MVGEEGGERRDGERGVRDEAEGEGGCGGSVEAEPALADEGDGGGGRRRELLENFLQQLIVEAVLHLTNLFSLCFVLCFWSLLLKNKPIVLGRSGFSRTEREGKMIR